MGTKCIVVANSNNLSGYLNNYTGDKLRIDYGQLLEFAKGGRECLGAIIVSQNDMSHNTIDSNKKKQARRFVYTLRAFGWTPLEVNYNSLEPDGLNPVISSIYDAVCNMLLDEDNNPKHDLSEVDLVVITGTGAWDAVIKPFADTLSVDVLYPQESTSAILKRNYTFYDLSPFIVESNRQVMEKKLSVLQSDFN